MITVRNSAPDHATHTPSCIPNGCWHDVHESWAICGGSIADYMERVFTRMAAAPSEARHRFTGLVGAPSKISQDGVQPGAWKGSICHKLALRQK